MKKNYAIFSLLLGLLLASNGYSQTFSGYGSTPSNDNYNYVNFSSDTMYYTFNSLPGGAYDDAILTIDGSAYFDWNSSYKVYGPGLVLLGNIAASGVYNCDHFSASLTIPYADINAYGGNAVFKLVKQGNVYPYCDDNRLRVKLQYHYCATGTPSQQASISMTDHSLCQSEGVVNLNVSPAGGTLSGAGVSNNALNVSTLPFGRYNVTYTYTEANGCYTQDSAQYIVLENPADVSLTTCENTSPVMNSGNIATVYASDLGLSTILGTGTSVTLPPVTTNPTYIYSAKVSSQYAYEINAIDTTNFQMIDHEAVSGDDRGGIAVSANYVYIVGDDATARYDLNMQNGVDLPKRDGIFTDLAQLKLYTLYSTVAPAMPNYDNQNGFTMNALRSLNEDLTYGSEIIPLSQPISFGIQDQGVILAGYNELIVGTAYGNYDFYHISILSGQVTPLGQHNLDVYGSENWADWGMSGFDGTDHHAYFRDGNDSIVDFNFTTNTSTSIMTITDFSDLSSFIAHPVNNRFYGHYEGSTSTFGGDEENLFYFQISDSAMPLAPTAANYGCPNKITFTFNTIDLGADTTVCSEDGLYIIPGGFGYNSYTWNGVNNNFNSFPVQATGEVVLSVVDNANCVLTDSVHVTVTSCTAGLNELANQSMQIYPVPNNGAFQVTFDALAEESQISVIDVQGKQIATQTLLAGETMVSMNLDVQPGIYFIRLTSENRTSQQAISVQ